MNEIEKLLKKYDVQAMNDDNFKKELLDLFNVRLSLPDAKYIRSLLPDWTKEAPKGLHPTMYGTCTQEGDQKVIDNINRILGNEAQQANDRDYEKIEE